MKLSVEEIVSPTWASAVMILERVSPTANFALRLGLIEQLHRVLDEMAHHDAKPELVSTARGLIEALAHMRWD